MKKSLLFFIACIVTMISLQAQNFNRSMNLNMVCVSDTTFNPFDGNTVTSIGITGQVTFTSELGFVRFVVSDNNDDEYLVYETYRIYEDDSNIAFSQKCEESCFYETYTPNALKVYVFDAVVTISCINYSNTLYQNAEFRRRQAARNAYLETLSEVQDYIADNNLIWVADSTSFSKMSYAKKAKMMGKGFRDYGLEFYSHGFFDIACSEFRGDDDQSCGYVDNFDWRTRHNADQPSSSYYNSGGKGWITPIKCQGEGCILDCSFITYLDDPDINQETCEDMGGVWDGAPTCWIFGATAQVEAMTNLYFNQFINPDLSEQYIVCKDGTNTNGNIHGGFPYKALNRFKSDYVGYEDDLPYVATSCNCDEIPEMPNHGIRIENWERVSPSTQNEIKKALMQHGPIVVGSIPEYYGLENHVMLLVGWGTLDEKSLSYWGSNNNIIIPESDYGTTFWIYKDTMLPGESHHEGYIYSVHLFGEMASEYDRIVTPIHTTENYFVHVEDKDNDGYLFWGIGPKPAGYENYPDEPDGNDNDPTLGPINSKGQCSILSSYTASFEQDWDNWIQLDTLGYNDAGRNWWRHSGPSENPNSQYTGPTQAQDGDCYIYLNSGYGHDMNNKQFALLSPPINFPESGPISIDFYYDLSTLYANGEPNSICVYYKKENGNWAKAVTLKGTTESEGWQHCTVAVPYTKQILIIGKTAEQIGDVALDNITIKPWEYDDTPIVITGTETWTQENYFNQDIIIEDGGKLILQGDVNENPIQIHMHPDCKIIVKPGGQLIDNSFWLLPFPNTHLWQGIEVWGNPNAHQYYDYDDDKYLQGYVELGERSIIEKAVCALRLYSSEEWGHMGGIVHADGAFFYDNNKSVHAWYYHNFNPYNHKETNYNSYFKNCTFDLRIGGYSQLSNPPMFYKHVDLNNVKGISFKACEFSIPSMSKDYVSTWSCGIAAYDAGFTVDGICQSLTIPCSRYKKSIFKHFFNAILVDNSFGNHYTLTVKNTEFRNNAYGVFARNLDFATVLNSSFRVGKHSNLLCSGGIYLDGTSGFTIEENVFQNNTDIDDLHTFGIIVSNSGTSNTIYRNTFNGLKCGNLAFGVNHLTNQMQEGLLYGCNDNSENGYDFFVLKDPYSPVGSLNGPQSLQGSMSISSGNTFSSTADYHFYNDGDYDVDYYYNNSGNEIPDINRLYKVARHDAPANNCASNYGSDPQLVLSSTERQQRETDYYNAYATYSIIKTLYERRVDGGNTNSTLADVENARPEDMWQLRAKLLGGSPYLSQDVLMRASDRTDVFPNSVLFEILASNPDELKKDTLISYLENKNEPLPAYMVDMLRQVAAGTTLKTAMLNQMASYKHSYTEAAIAIVRSLLNDTVVDNVALRGWLGNMNDIHADYDIISTYIADNDFNEALSFANLLPNLYGLEGAALDEHDDYMDLLYLYRDLHQDGRNIMQLNNTEKALVQHIADYGTGKPKVMAISILEGAYNSTDYFYCHELNISGGGNRGGGLYVPISSETLGKMYGLSIAAMPNPAQTWVVFSYTLPENVVNAVVTVTDMLGAVVGQYEVNSAAGEYVWNCTDVKPGVYYYTIACDGLTRTDKLVITK